MSVPGGLRRLLREPSRLVAVLLIALVAVSASGVQSAAALVLHSTLQANWRGAYDILVTAKDATATLDQYLAPNSLASGQRLTMKQLAKIRGVDGVDVAAPLGEILVPGLKGGETQLEIPADSVGATDKPQAYRVTATYTTNDGLGKRLVSTTTTPIVVDESETGAQAPKCLPSKVGNFAVDPKKYPEVAAQLCVTTDHSAKNGAYSLESASSYGSDNDASDGTWNIDLGATPQTTSRVTLVDPVAEAKLLGTQGSFLQPLIAIAPTAKTRPKDLKKWAQDTSGRYASAYLSDDRNLALQTGYTPQYIKEMRALYLANGSDFDVELKANTTPQPAVPVLVSNAQVAPLDVQVKVESFGPATSSSDLNFPFRLPAALTAGKIGSSVGTVSTDLSSNLNPFTSSLAQVPWPGTDLSKLNTASLNQLSIGYVAQPTDAALSIGKKGASLHGLGFRSTNALDNFDHPFVLSSKGTSAGVESAYTGFGSGKVLIGSSSVAIPVGSFPTDVAKRLQAPLDFVPLGAYQPVASTLPNGKDLQPSVTGLGLVSPRTIAIASINSAGAWGDKAPIDAVRVRVSNVGAYSTRAEERVLAVAQRIRALGFDATIVAGSSPSDVKVTVDDYAFGVSSATQKQKVGTLGKVTQQWSELGAASRADLAISAGTLSVLILALAAVTVLLGAVQFAGVPRRQSRAAIMRELGFTRVRNARWMAAEELPGVVIVALAGAVATWIADFSTVSIAVAVAAVVVVAVLSVVAVVASVLTVSKRRPSRRSARLGATTPGAFGARQALLHPGVALSQLVAVVIVGISSAAIALVLLQARANAGSSLVAQLTLSQALVPQLALAAAGIGAGITLAVIARRNDLARRAPQWAAMRAMGWTTSELGRAQRRESIVISIPAIIVAGLVTVIVAGLISAIAPLAITAVAVLASLVAASVLLSTRRKATP